MSDESVPALPAALDAERHEFVGRAGDQSYYAAGTGAPLLLLHSINAAGSAYEMRPIFEHYRSTRRVFAPDLPGFGFSDRSTRRYSPRLYTDAIHDLLDRLPPHTPVDAFALSLSSEFLARAASERPERFRSLGMITPTGFDRRGDKLRASDGETREVPGLYSVLTVPLWRRGLYRGLTRPGVIRYFLKRTYGSDHVDDGLAEYARVTARQPGAGNAPYAFLSARLFSKDIRRVYETLRLPVWLAHATRGDFKDFSGADWAREADNWTVQAIEGGALPHFEAPKEFFAAADAFLAGVD